MGSDHAGRTLRQTLASQLRDMGHTVADLGTHSDAAVDYALCARQVANAVISGQCELAVLCCGTGIGVSIAANRHPGVRAALCHDTFSAKMARAHNDANILCLGQRVIGPGLAGEILNAFLTTPFAGGRHQRRVDQLALPWEHL